MPMAPGTMWWEAAKYVIPRPWMWPVAFWFIVRALLNNWLEQTYGTVEPKL